MDREQPHRQEALLSNQSFRRLAQGFKLYQQLLAEATKEGDKQIIETRMRELYHSTLAPESPPNLPLFPELQRIVREVIERCKQGAFSLNDFAALVLEVPPLADHLIARWNPKAETIRVDGGDMMVNEIVGYSISPEEELSINLVTGNLKPNEIVTKVKAGLRILAERLKTGEIATKQVRMHSWLLGSRYTRLVHEVLGRDVLPQLPEQRISFVGLDAAQTLALQFNSSVLKRYLLTGEKPEVREVLMSREEFVKRFCEK